MSRVVELARELVRIPSVNPDGDATGSGCGEAEMAGFLQGWLTARGAEAALHEVLPGRPNVVARFPTDKPGKPRLLLAPHTDTVSVEGMTIPPFEGRILDGRLYGRGASDTKGPMAAMLAALDSLGSEVERLPWEIWFAGLMGEETGQQGSKALAECECFDFVVVGEPTGLEVVHAHKGSHRWKLHVPGKAAHSSTPEAGDNAIEKAIRAVAWIQREFQASARPSPILGHPTSSLGVMRGGTRVNIVPEHCIVELDIRTVPEFDSSALLAAFRDAWPEVKIEETLALPLHTSADHPVIQHFVSLGARRAVAPWFCDAASFSARGMPAVAIGPGSIAQAHTADEFIPIADLEAGANFFERWLRSLAPLLP